MLPVSSDLAEALTPAVRIAILDRTGRITAVNEAWKEFGIRSGLQLPDYGVGASYLAYCARDNASNHVQHDIRELLAGRVNLITHVYPCNSPSGRSWFFMIGLPLGEHARTGVALMHIDITSFLPQSKQVDTSALAHDLEKSSLDALSHQVIGMLLDRTAPAESHRTDESIDEVLHLAGLSERQLEILGFLAQGKSNAEIARALHRSPNTIREHVSAILRRLNLKSRTQAALLASKHLGEHFDLHPRPAARPKRL